MQPIQQLQNVSLWLLTAAFLLLTSAQPLQAQQQETGTATAITVLTHDSFSVSEDVLAQFQADTGISVKILRGGDAGQVVNQAILTQGNPLADVLFGVDNTFLSRALDAGIFEPYASPNLDAVDAQFLQYLADPNSENGELNHSVTPIDYGDVCLNYDIAYFEENDLTLPESLADLTDPAYESLLVAMNPATSSPGLAFMLATIAEFGTEGDYTYLDYWADLIDNGTRITDGWSDAYFGDFTVASEDGTYPLVVSYASSPPFTLDEATGQPLSASITADGMCFRQVEFAGILTNSEHTQAAQQFIDFMLSVPFQQDVPLQMFVFPVNVNAELPQDFAQYAAIPENPAQLDAANIEANREAWIQAWTETVLR
jgi:thiamine transport system substrate-binding protein